MATVKQQRRRVWIWQARKKTEQQSNRNERQAMKKHYNIYVPAFIYDDLKIGTIDYNPTNNEATLQLDGEKERYFASVAAAMNCVKQSHPHAYIEERRCV